MIFLMVLFVSMNVEAEQDYFFMRLCPGGRAKSYSLTAEAKRLKCQAEVESDRCQDYYAKNKIEEKYQRKCDVEYPDDYLAFKANRQEMGRYCATLLGTTAWENTKGFAKDLRDVAKYSLEKFVACNTPFNNEKCGSKYVSDLKNKMMNLNMDDPWLPSWNTSNFKPATKSLYATIQKTIADSGAKWNCMDQTVRQQTFCVGMGHALSPEAELATGIKTIAKLARIKGIEKLAITETKITQLPVATIAARAETKSIYLAKTDAEKKVVSDAQHKAWVKYADKHVKDDGKTMYLVTENGLKRDLNNKISKEYSDALDLKYKETLYAKAKEVAKKYPNVKMLSYSDFKSMKFAFVAKKGELPKELADELSRIYAETGDEFLTSIRKDNLVDADVLAEQWMRGSIGRTPDTSEVAARLARDEKDPRKILNCDDAEFSEKLNDSFIAAKEAEKVVLSRLKTTSLLEKPNALTKQKTLHPDVDIIMRTYGDDKVQMKKALEDRFATHLFDGDIEALLDHQNKIDVFSPAIRIAERKRASLNDSKLGGIAFDFSNMGANNKQATAEAVSISKTALEAIENSRRNEAYVTGKFKEAANSVQSQVEPILKKHGYVYEIKKSGDDGIIVPLNKAFTAQVNQEILEAVAKNSEKARLRLVHVPGGKATDGLRGEMTQIGEKFEKETRMAVSSVVSNNKLKNVYMMVEMDGQKPNLKIFDNNEAAFKLDQTEIEHLQQAFEQTRKNAPIPK